MHKLIYSSSIIQVLLVDAPFVFQPGWTMIKPWVGKYAALVGYPLYCNFEFSVTFCGHKFHHFGVDVFCWSSIVEQTVLSCCTFGWHMSSVIINQHNLLLLLSLLKSLHILDANQFSSSRVEFSKTLEDYYVCRSPNFLNVNNELKSFAVSGLLFAGSILLCRRCAKWLLHSWYHSQELQRVVEWNNTPSINDGAVVAHSDNRDFLQRTVPIQSTKGTRKLFVRGQSFVCKVLLLCNLSQ